MSKKEAKKTSTNKKIVLDAGQIMQVEQMAACGMTIEQMSDFFGFSKDTFYEIRKRQPDVLRHYKKGKSQSLWYSANALRKKIKEGDTTAIIFYLKAQGGWSTENSKKLKVSISDDATPVDIINKAISEIREGNITLPEIKQLTDLAQVKQQLLANSTPEEQEHKRYTLEECLEISNTLLGAASVMEKKLGKEENV